MVRAYSVDWLLHLHIRVFSQPLLEDVVSAPRFITIIAFTVAGGGQLEGGLKMPLFRITVIRRVNTNGVRLEPGMSVEVVTNSYSDPVHTNGGQCVVDAFRRIYGVDIRRANALNGIYLKVTKIF